MKNIKPHIILFIFSIVVMIATAVIIFIYNTGDNVESSYNIHYVMENEKDKNNSIPPYIFFLFLTK